MAELLVPIPKAAYTAATRALDEYRAPLLADPQLGTARSAAIAVTAAAPLIQQRAYRHLVTTKPAIGLVFQAFVAVGLTWGTLALVALTTSGWLRILAAGAIVVNVFVHFNSKRFTKEMKGRAAKLLDEREADHA